MDISMNNKYSFFSLEKRGGIKQIGNRASVSIEALFTIPIFIFLMMFFIFMLRFIAIDDSFNQCLYETSLEYSSLENSSSDIINSALINLLLKKNLSEMNLELDSVVLASSKDNFVDIKAFYTIKSFISKPLTFKEDIRLYKRTKYIKEYVYITPKGKKYHYEDCILTKGRGVRYEISDVPDDISPCKNCILGKRYFEKKRQ